LKPAYQAFILFPGGTMKNPFTMPRQLLLSLFLFSLTIQFGFAQSTRDLSFISVVNGKSMLYIFEFENKKLGKFKNSVEISKSDRILGWSWNGKEASYVANTNGQSILYIRDFDGKTFGKDYKEITISKSGRIRGWSWDGETASYVAVTNGQAVLYIQKFDGTTFVNTNKTFVLSKSDHIRGWSWDGETASYVSVHGGKSKLFVVEFNGMSFKTRLDQDEFSNADDIRGLQLPRYKPSKLEKYKSPTIESEIAQSTRDLSYICLVNGKSMLHTYEYNNKEIGKYKNSVEILKSDRMLGWSWNGKKASYVANTNGQSILYIRDFDGKTFGKDYKEFTISKSGRIRGWSWDGETASYVAVTNGQAVLYIQKFDGTTFVNTNKTFVLSKSDRIRGWSWDGETASYVAVLNGESRLYIVEFDGNAFSTKLDDDKLSNADDIRGLQLPRYKPAKVPYDYGKPVQLFPETYVVPALTYTTARCGELSSNAETRAEDLRKCIETVKAWNGNTIKIDYPEIKDASWNVPLGKILRTELPIDDETKDEDIFTLLLVNKNRVLNREMLKNAIADLQKTGQDYGDIFDIYHWFDRAVYVSRFLEHSEDMYWKMKATELSTINKVWDWTMRHSDDTSTPISEQMEQAAISLAGNIAGFVPVVGDVLGGINIFLDGIDLITLGVQASNNPNPPQPGRTVEQLRKYITDRITQRYLNRDNEIESSELPKFREMIMSSSTLLLATKNYAQLTFRFYQSFYTGSIDSDTLYAASLKAFQQKLLDKRTKQVEKMLWGFLLEQRLMLFGYRVKRTTLNPGNTPEARCAGAAPLTFQGLTSLSQSPYPVFYTSEHHSDSRDREPIWTEVIYRWELRTGREAINKPGFEWQALLSEDSTEPSLAALQNLCEHYPPEELAKKLRNHMYVDKPSIDASFNMDRGYLKLLGGNLFSCYKYSPLLQKKYTEE
jgi:Tol biopolymer transport system component